MEGSKTPVSLEQIEGEARGYRLRVDHEPTDVSARVNLAWCLFIQAMHQAGREHGRTRLMESEAHSEPSRTIELRREPDAQHLLRECFVQMCAAWDLSRDPADVADIKRLRFLVSISGAEFALHQAEEEAHRQRAGMAKAILTPPSAPSRRRRRVNRGLP